MDADNDNQDHHRSSNSHANMTVTSTDTTIRRVYTQYQAQLFNPMYANNSSPVPVIPHVLRPWDAAMSRTKNVQEQLVNTPASSPKKSGLLVTAPTRESLLYPKPLRVQSIRAEGKHTSLHSGIAISATGMTTDSEEDPFRYDKDAYSIFLHPSKERDVSTALNQVSGLSSHSRATVYSDVDELPSRQISAQQPTATKKYNGDEFSSSDPRKVRSPTPESLNEFYDTSFIQPSWAADRGAYEVKVVLKDISRNLRINSSDRYMTGNGGYSKGNKGLRSSVLGPIQKDNLKENLYRRKDKENMFPSERDDWETVATTQGGFESLRLPLNEIGVRGVNVTGSSVADVSDDNSILEIHFKEYASTDRIVEHPSGHEDSVESLQIKNIGGYKVPLMIPKQRIHRVNGFSQAPPRLLPPPQRPGSELASALARKVSSPFWQRNGKHPRQFSPKQSLPFKFEKSKARFEFRHSSQSSDCDPLFAKGGEAYEFHRASTDAGNDTYNITTSGDMDDEDNHVHSLRDSHISPTSHGTEHGFPFSLIPLPEAARLQAVKRAVTIDTSEAGHHGPHLPESKKRSQATGPISIPERTHSRMPARLASVFATSSTQSLFHNRGLKSRNTMPRDLTMQTAMSSTTAGGTWTTIFPFGSTSARYGNPSHTLKSAATTLHLDDFSCRFQLRRKPVFTVGSGLTILSSTPRLYPWDYRTRRRQRARGTDPELRAVALAGSDSERRSRLHDLERNGVPLDPEAFISYEGRHRRKTWFLCMLAVSMFPFISIMVYLGKFDSGLSWYSRGEVDRLNRGQRQVILAVTVAQFVLWPVILGLVIWRTLAGSS
ncbi:MAG: hypothetical protein SEPTF4163_000295 [Sporothrix epigloea]